MLSQINAHPRDLNIVFEEIGHKYTITINDQCIIPTSVTTIIHHHFPPFDADAILDKMFNKPLSAKYAGKTKEQIKQEWSDSGTLASKLGTAMHADIENFLNGQVVHQPDSIEHKMFQKFWKDFTTTYPTVSPYRTEWLVYDEDKKIAGSIDFVCSTGNKNEVIIIDWKRSKEIKYTNRFQKGFSPFDKLDDCNYNHYRLQLNIYRHMLQSKYGMKVIFMMLVICHPDNQSYNCIPVDEYPIAEIWNDL